jgi:predicted membrane-bound mannosyltransferase
MAPRPVPTHLQVMSRALGSPYGLAASTVVVLILLMRLRELGTKPIWLDEAYSLDIARESLSNILIKLVPSQVPVYCFVLAGWVRLAGESETALRLPSVIAGASVAVAMVLTGREIGRPWAGVLGGVLFSVAPYAASGARKSSPRARRWRQRHGRRTSCCSRGGHGSGAGGLPMAS